MHVRSNQPPARGLGQDEPLDEGQEAKGDHTEGHNKEQCHDPVQGHSEIEHLDQQ